MHAYVQLNNNKVLIKTIQMAFLSARELRWADTSQPAKKSSKL
jgi:hypothetical protein